MQYSTTRIEDSRTGPILRVVFRSVNGDAAAAPVGDALSRLVTEQRPAGLVLDFTGSGYTEGDGICGVVILAAGKIPTVIVSSGPESPFLNRTLEVTGLIEHFGRKVFPAEPEAMAWLRGAIAASG